MKVHLANPSTSSGIPYGLQGIRVPVALISIQPLTCTACSLEGYKQGGLHLTFSSGQWVLSRRKGSKFGRSYSA